MPKEPILVLKMPEHSALNSPPVICPGDTTGSHKSDWKSIGPGLRQTCRGQVIPGFGTFLTTGTPVGFIGPITRREFAVGNMAFNLLFRYPIWATEDMPQGRWYPYIGIGGDAQRARLSIQGYEDQLLPCFSGIGRLQVLCDQVSGSLWRGEVDARLAHI